MDRLTGYAQEVGERMKYRKKPVVIEAWRYQGSLDDAPEFIKVRLDIKEITIDAISGLSLLLVDTHHGPTECAIGDWLIRGIEGEMYPCKDNIFQATYEAVE